MRDIEPQLLSSIVGDIYDCSLDPSAWPIALIRITSILDCAYSAISMTDVLQSKPRIQMHSPWDVERLQSLESDYGIEGVPGLKEVAYGDVDSPASTLAMMSEETFHASAFYQEWVKPQELKEACVMKFVHSEQRIGVMATVSRADRAVIGEAERSFLALLSPHIRRASLIGDLLNFERVKAELFRETLNEVATAVMLVDVSENLLFANTAAELLLTQGVTMSQKNGKLRLHNPSAANAVTQAIQLSHGFQDALGRRGIGIPLSRSGQSTAIAYVLPLGRTKTLSVHRNAVAAVFVSSEMQQRPPAQDLLITLFDLTLAEAKVMLLIGEGLTPAQAALKLNVSENTVKTHLSRIFSKTSTNRQSDLVKIVAELAPPTFGLSSNVLENT
jgi:DNA-binding CsgD family transcriptional regulator